MGFFNLSGYLPNSSSWNKYSSIAVEDILACQRFFELKALKYDSYSKIKNESFVLKANLGLNKKWKVRIF